MLSASTTYAGSAQQKGTATYFNPQGSVAAGNPSVSDYQDLARRNFPERDLSGVGCFRRYFLKRNRDTRPGETVISGSSPRLRAAIMARSSSLSFSRDKEARLGPKRERTSSKRGSAIATEVVSSQSQGPPVPSRCLSSSSANCSGVTFRLVGNAAIKKARTMIPNGTTTNQARLCKTYAVRAAGRNKTSSTITQPDNFGGNN